MSPVPHDSPHFVLTLPAGFRVLSENERTAALYSLLQHATTSQIRFFQKVLSQMSQSDPMTALLSPAVGSSMQREMEARLASANASMSASANLAAVTGMKSPVAPTLAGFGGTPTFPSSPGFLGAENPVPADGSSGFGSPSAQLAAQRNRNRQQNRISAPGNLHHLSSQTDGTDGGLRGTAGYLGSTHLGDVIERGSSPADESTASRSPGLGAIGSDATGGHRPKSADFATLAAAAAAASAQHEGGRSPFARASSPRLGSSALAGPSASSSATTTTTHDAMAQAQQAMVGLGLPAATTQALHQHLNVTSSPSFADQFSPLLHSNWASIGNTPMMSTFHPNEFTGGASTSDPQQLAAQLAALSTASPALHGSPGGRLVLDDATKYRRTVSGGRHQGQASPALGSNGDRPAAYASQNWRAQPGANDYGTAGLNGLGIAGGGMGLGIAGGGFDTYGGMQGLGVGLPSNGAGDRSRAAPRQSSRATASARKSPMIGGGPAQAAPQATGTSGNGGAGSGAGVGGAEDVDERILKDTANWLRVLRLHVSTQLMPVCRTWVTDFRCVWIEIYPEFRRRRVARDDSDGFGHARAARRRGARRTTKASPGESFLGRQQSIPHLLSENATDSRRLQTYESTMALRIPSGTCPRPSPRPALLVRAEVIRLGSVKDWIMNMRFCRHVCIGYS